MAVAVATALERQDLPLSGHSPKQYHNKPKEIINPLLRTPTLERRRTPARN
jgi:hypothetical protein